MIRVEDAQALRARRGLAVVESGDRGAALGQAVALGQSLILPEHRSGDLVMVTPEGDRWTVDELNSQVLAQSVLQPLGEQRVLIVDQADRMDARTFDHLLKTVEEPTSVVLYLFVVPDASQLPTTIQSRIMHTVSVPPRSYQDVAAAMQTTVGQAPTPQVVAASMKGSLLSAALTGADAVSVYTHADAVFASQATHPAVRTFQVAKGLKELAAVVSGKASTSPVTKAAQRELVRVWLEVLQEDLLQAAGKNGAAWAMSRYDKVEFALELHSRHLPVEHVLAAALLEVTR